MASYEVPENCRIGSKDYDDDIIFVEQYIRVAKRTATKEEVISLFRTFQSKILEYITFTRKNIEQLRDVYFTVKDNHPEAAQYSQMDYDTLKIKCKDEKCPEFIKKIVNNYSLYNNMTNSSQDTFEAAENFFEEISDIDYHPPGPLLAREEDLTIYEQLIHNILPAMYKWYNEMDPENGMYHYTNDVIWDLEQGGISKSHLREFQRINLDPIDSGLYKPKELEDKFRSLIDDDVLMNRVQDQMEKSLEVYKHNNRVKYSEYILCINEISEQLFDLAYFNCLRTKPIKKTSSLIKPSQRKLSDEIRLVNGNGLFGLNTYLYALFNGYFLIGVPSIFPSYDLRKNECPATFVRHDINHKDIILRSNRYRKYEDSYYEIIKDPKLTIRQKELMIMTIWSLIHEGPFLDQINLRGDPIENSFRSMIVSTLFVEFFDEFRRFDELILTQDLFNEMKDKLSKGIKIETADPLSLSRNPVVLKFLSLEELTGYLRNSDVAKVSRGNLYFNLCTVYTLLIISKYYNQ